MNPYFYSQDLDIWCISHFLPCCDPTESSLRGDTLFWLTVQEVTVHQNQESMPEFMVREVQVWDPSNLDQAGRGWGLLARSWLSFSSV